MTSINGTLDALGESKNESFGSAGDQSHLIERVYKSQYDVMRQAYEQRIVQLSDVIQDTCQAMLSDEVLTSKQNDPVAAAYTLPHIHELLSTHIESEREKYIHSLIQKVGDLEGTNRNLTEKNNVLSKKMNTLEMETKKGHKAEQALDALFNKYGSMEKEYEESKKEVEEIKIYLRNEIENLESIRTQQNLTIDSLNDTVISQKEENKRLIKTKEDQKKEILTLSSALEQSARDIAMIEDVDKEEQEAC